MTHGDTPGSLRCCFFSSECPARAPALARRRVSTRVSGRRAAPFSLRVVARGEPRIRAAFVSPEYYARIGCTFKYRL